MLDLLAMHIAGSCEFAQWPEQGLSLKRLELADWLSDAKTRVGCQWFASRLALISSVPASDAPVLFPIKPRRRAGFERVA